MRHLDIRDLLAGLVLIGVGLFVALYASTHYQIGEPSRMGPGFFPTALGWILVVLGAIVTLMAFRKTVHAIEPPPFEWRPFAAVLVAVLVFGLFIEKLGLIPTALIVIVITAMAENQFRWKKAILLGIFLALLSWLIFTIGLQMTLPAFAFLG